VRQKVRYQKGLATELQLTTAKSHLNTSPRRVQAQLVEELEVCFALLQNVHQETSQIAIHDLVVASSGNMLEKE
jgi:hypothetical protein